MTSAEAKKRGKGAPLAMIGLVVAVWITGRAAIWENPFPARLLSPDVSQDLIARADAPFDSGLQASPEPAVLISGPLQAQTRDGLSSPLALLASAAGISGLTTSTWRSARDYPASRKIAHNSLWLAALGAGRSAPAIRPSAIGQSDTRFSGISPASPLLEKMPDINRWSLDAWGFVRQGSNSTAISQGRVPIYGASQIGATAQFRIDPQSRHDPRLYLRAYRALVTGGETEFAAGASARPIADLPVRVAAEMRVTENRFGTDLRPAAFAVTELPAQDLVAGLRLEAYGGAGYVGGDGATAFVDGQASVTRQVADFDGPADTKARLSLGAGAWGGAQSDASRVDVGPTLRLDLTMGEVPARLSVDWRERVGGDAAPESGIAATLSTRF